MAGAPEDSFQVMQARHLIEHHRYLVTRYAPDCRTALDVGCGRGYVTEGLSDILGIRGVDLDMEGVVHARERGLDVIHGDGLELPLKDSSVDLVLCSFYLMWVNDIERAVREMFRVAKRKVLFLSEPAWSRSFIEPTTMKEILDASISWIRAEGGDPDSGLELLRVLRRSGSEHRFGTIPVDASPGEMRGHLRDWMKSLKIGFSERADPLILHVPLIWAVADASR